MRRVRRRNTEVESYTSGDSGGVSLDEGDSLEGPKGTQEKVGVVVRFASVQVNDGYWDHHCFVLPVGIHGLKDEFFKDFPWVEDRGLWGFLEVLEYQFLGRPVEFPLPVRFKVFLLHKLLYSGVYDLLREFSWSFL